MSSLSNTYQAQHVISQHAYKIIPDPDQYIEALKGVVLNDALNDNPGTTADDWLLESVCTTDPHSMDMIINIKCKLKIFNMIVSTKNKLTLAEHNGLTRLFNSWDIHQGMKFLRTVDLPSNHKIVVERRDSPHSWTWCITVYEYGVPMPIIQYYSTHEMPVRLRQFLKQAYDLQFSHDKV